MAQLFCDIKDCRATDTLPRLRSRPPEGWVQRGRFDFCPKHAAILFPAPPATMRCAGCGVFKTAESDPLGWMGSFCGLCADPKTKEE